MSEWTKEREQRFWARIGFTLGDYPEPRLEPDERAWYDPDGIFYGGLPHGLPSINSLDYLFLYAIPALRNAFIERFKYTRYGKEHIEGGLAQFAYFLRDWTDKLLDPSIDPALSLAEAIEKKFDGILKEVINK